MESNALKASSTQTSAPELSRVIRAGEWWEFKLAPIFATIYATAFLLNTSISSLWSLLLLVLFALVPGAAYVSVINDLTDLRDDVASGKNNRLIGKSNRFIAVILACCVLSGISLLVHWRHDPLLFSLYLGAWTAFSLYSIPPFRFKSRGILGPLADASGAHLFPTLLVVSLVFRWRGLPIDHVWFVSVALWSLCFGLRGILWHQLGDLHHDEQIGLQTFARRHNVSLLLNLGNFVIFPIEISAFAVMLWRAGSGFALGSLCFYALLEALRKRLWRTHLVIVVPRERYRILMLEYYEVFYPLVFLISSSVHYPQDAIIVVAHLLLFPRRAIQTVKDLLQLGRDLPKLF